MSESKTARNYENIRSHIHFVMGIIAAIMLFPPVFRYHFDSWRLFLYRLIASAAMLAAGSASWVIFIRFRNDSSWILKELGLEGNDLGGSENSTRAGAYTFTSLLLLIWWFLYVDSDRISAITPGITIMVALSSVHYLSIVLSRMLGMYRYKNAETDADPESGKILKSLYKINKSYQNYYTVFLALSTVFCILYLMFSLPLSDNLESVTAMFRLLLVCVSIGSFCFLMSRFIVNCMIFHLNDFSDTTSYKKNKLLEMAFSQTKFTASIIIFPVLPLLYGTAFFIIFKSLPAFFSPVSP